MNTNNEDVTLNDDVDEVTVTEGMTLEEKDEALAKLQDTNRQLYARTKKAEGFVQDDSGKWIKTPVKAIENKEITATTKTSQDNLSQTDVITLARADIPEEDIPEVLEYAKFKGISVAEALKSPIIKTTLADKAEARKVAEGTSTGSGRRSSARLSDDALMENASKGILPESDEDIQRLTRIRITKGKK